MERKIIHEPRGKHILVFARAFSSSDKSRECTPPVVHLPQCNSAVHPDCLKPDKTPWEDPCKTSCQSACEKSCKETCKTSCQSACEKSCQETCKTSCQTACEKSCKTASETACQTDCQLSHIYAKKETGSGCGNYEVCLSHIESAKPKK